MGVNFSRELSLRTHKNIFHLFDHVEDGTISKCFEMFGSSVSERKLQLFLEEDSRTTAFRGAQVRLILKRR